MKHYGIILRKIRTDNALTLEAESSLIQRITGWPMTEPAIFYK